MEFEEKFNNKESHVDFVRNRKSWEDIDSESIKQTDMKRPPTPYPKPKAKAKPKPKPNPKPKIFPCKEIGIAKYEFIAENADELSFKKGDRITIISKDKNIGGEGWWVGEIGGSKGVFPQDYVILQ